MTSDPEQGKEERDAGNTGAGWQQALDGNKLETLAAAAHDVFLESLSTDEKRSNNAALPYDLLPDHLKEQNRANVRDMAAKLALAGFSIAPNRENEQPVVFSDALLEQLAENAG
jgi:hypothetical protein